MGALEEVLGIGADREPEPELDPGLLEKIRQTIPPDDQQRVIDAILATMRGTPPSGPPAEDWGGASGRKTG